MDWPKQIVLPNWSITATSTCTCIPWMGCQSIAACCPSILPLAIYIGPWHDTAQILSRRQYTLKTKIFGLIIFGRQTLGEKLSDHFLAISGVFSLNCWTENSVTIQRVNNMLNSVNKNKQNRVNSA